MKHAIFALFALTAPAFAEVHEVKMLNRGAEGAMVYEPSFLRIQPGDTVRFLPTQPGHNAASIDDMTPDGAVPFKSRINEEFETIFDISGTYGIKCSPHYAMGMVMLVQVGDGEIAALPDGLPERAAERFRAIMAKAAQ